ncbi:MAG TPA: DNA polymerase/3'-5' exonuclease PolX [Anaerolineales bacterium]|nr:DNA polymerase/3'-5' exonuclease PolX [Anaerolineales bacterium]
MKNREIAEIFGRIADLLEIKGEAVYRVVAYRRAGEALRSLGRDVNYIWEEGSLEAIPDVGKGIAAKIDELLRTGHLEFYEKLTAEVPAGLAEILKVGGIGPKKVARFWKEQGITTIDELEQAARSGKLRQLSGIGERSEARILENILALKRHDTGRILLGEAWTTAQKLLSRLREVEGVQRAEAAGSVRRMRETIGDLDLLVGARDTSLVTQAFVDFPEVDRVLGHGETKSSVELLDGLRVQLWVHPPERFGSALQYATGSQGHNVRLREAAQKTGLSLSEHGYLDQEGSMIFCAQEEDVYAVLGLPWIPPALREDRGEIKAAKEGKLPRLVELEDLRGELHTHSQWSDGRLSILEMAEAAIELGMEYLVISDHSRSLGIAAGLSIEDLHAQRTEINRVQKKIGTKLFLFQGSEVEILADGELDYPDEVLQELDIVIAALHMSLRQPRQQVTERILRTIRNPHVDIIAHLTGRLIGRRDPADLDIEAILQAAAEHDVVLEINSNPERLDLKDTHARRALESGCRLAITTDAHHPDHFDFRRFGVGTAQRAWAESLSIVNTWPLDKLQSWLQSRG